VDASGMLIDIAHLIESKSVEKYQIATAVPPSN